MTFERKASGCAGVYIGCVGAHRQFFLMVADILASNCHNAMQSRQSICISILGVVKFAKC